MFNNQDYMYQVSRVEDMFKPQCSVEYVEAYYAKPEVKKSECRVKIAGACIIK